MDRLRGFRLLRGMHWLASSAFTQYSTVLIVLVAIGLAMSANLAHADKTAIPVTFSFISSMNVAHAKHPLTLLSEGKVPSYTSLRCECSAIDPCRLFYPARHRWTITGNTNDGHAHEWGWR